jgi:hypothetical protein
LALEKDAPSRNGCFGAFCSPAFTYFWVKTQKAQVCAKNSFGFVFIFDIQIRF